MSTNGFAQFLIGIPWFAWIPITAIVCSTITQAIEKSHRHRERIEMIRQGMNPDSGKYNQPEL